MVRCFHAVVLVCSIATFATLAISTGSTNWKEDLDIYKNMHKYIGLWRACINVKGDSVSELPPYQECDRDFLRPRLQEPPGWFNAVRVLMLMSCIGSGFGIFLVVTAIVTDKAKKTGSRMWICGLLVLLSGVLAIAALAIFSQHFEWSVEYAHTAGRYYATHWHKQPDHSMVDGVFFKIEIWLRWSFAVGWAGAAMSVFTFITAVLSDLTRGVTILKY
ncbi:uncharacterized protein [Clytia hemisphaerica]|uniref:Claudin n=1 Tax=Clytia hemisphaerica TaxID=252671 RepID=A0A7M5VB08_9CNID|eukprot:TCONS_00065489-protein